VSEEIPIFENLSARENLFKDKIESLLRQAVRTLLVVSSVPVPVELRVLVHGFRLDRLNRSHPPLRFQCNELNDYGVGWSFFSNYYSSWSSTSFGDLG
jgi:hypothetical protein